MRKGWIPTFLLMAVLLFGATTVKADGVIIGGNAPTVSGAEKGKKDGVIIGGNVLSTIFGVIIGGFASNGVIIGGNALTPGVIIGG
jgi:hypothetical protein